MGLRQSLPAAAWLAWQGLGGWLGEGSREDSLHPLPGSWGCEYRGEVNRANGWDGQQQRGSPCPLPITG